MKGEEIHLPAIHLWSYKL